MIATFTKMMIAEVSGKMRETATPVELTPAMRAVLAGLTDILDKYACTAADDEHDSSETQKSSSKTEREVMTMLKSLGVPEVKKSTATGKKAVAAGVYEFGAFTDDYFGFERSVKHDHSCRFVIPETDGVIAIHSPYGSQANPDVLLLDVGGKEVVCSFGIEVKSGGPTWNTHIQFTQRKMMYVAFKKEGIQYFFGDHIRSRESWIHALAWDELQRQLAKELNGVAAESGLQNYCVPYPKQEFRKLDLTTGSAARHAEIKAFFTPPAAEAVAVAVAEAAE